MTRDEALALRPGDLVMVGGRATTYMGWRMCRVLHGVDRPGQRMVIDVGRTARDIDPTGVPMRHPTAQELLTLSVGDFAEGL